MEYIKKEELIEGEIYVFDNKFINKIQNGHLNIKCWISIPDEYFYKNSSNNQTNNIINATSEEKHWLNEAIRLDKFITFEEAMKTFIPEYVECVKSLTGITIGKILLVENNMVIDGTFNNYSIKANDIYNYFKPSTKEAYDAQFVVKEPAENKTELEIWLENTKSLNLSLEDLEKYINSSQTCNFDNIYMKLEGRYANGRAKILFDKWNEKVIEPLPQFKVIETIETITKVENNEGNQFFIGDVVKTEAGLHFKIIGFKYDENKTKILAIATDNYPEVVKDINDIEHYIEPKVEETLLEKAKKLYPVGTKFINPNDNRECVIKEKGNYFEGNNHNIYHSIANRVFKYEEGFSGCIYINNTWSKIIK